MAHESLKSIREERKHYAMSSADYRKTVLNPDFKSRQPAPRSPRVFTPAKAYTPAEIDRMSSAEYKAAVMGILDHASGESQVLATPDRSGQRKRSSSLRGLKRAGIE
jgi:hypothetical protein